MREPNRWDDWTPDTVTVTPPSVADVIGRVIAKADAGVAPHAYVEELWAGGPCGTGPAYRCRICGGQASEHNPKP